MCEETCTRVRSWLGFCVWRTRLFAMGRFRVGGWVGGWVEGFCVMASVFSSSYMMCVCLGDREREMGEGAFCVCAWVGR